MANNKRLLNISLLFILFHISASNLLNCSNQIKWPCSCLPLPSKKIAVICARGNSLEHLLDGIKPLQHWPEPIEILRLEDTPIPSLYLDELGPIFSHPIRRFVLRNNSLSKFLVRPNFVGPTPHILETVEHLEISKNEIIHISNCPALALFRNLRILSFSKNLLARIPAHTFLHFHSRRTLQQLDLNGNVLSERGIPPEAFLGLESMQKLSLDKNQLSRVPTEAVAKLADSLEELFLSANQIDEIEPPDVPFLPRLKSLGLDVNQISWLNGEIFRSTPSLCYLYLGQNQFPTIPPNMLAFLPELKVLLMGGNPLDRLDAEAFQFVSSLLRLDLSNCQIHQIHIDTFGPIPRLQFLNLRGNRLDQIQRGLFTDKLPFLVSLDLAKNQLTQIEDLGGLGQLESLDLSANRIASFERPNIFRETFRIGTANLEGNPIDCSPVKIEWLWTLQRRIRVKGNCGQPPNLREMPLANLTAAQIVVSHHQISMIKRTTEATTKSITGPTKKAIKNVEIVGKVNEFVTAIPTTTTFSIIQMSTPKIVGKQIIVPNSTVKILENSPQKPNEKETSWAILFMVMAIVALGLILVCLLAFRPILLRQCPCPSNGKIAQMDECFRLKHFGTSKSFTPSNNITNYSPTSNESMPALLTTLNHIQTINSSQKKTLPNKRHQNATFYMENERKMSEIMEIGNTNDQRDRWRIQREHFWF